MCAVRPYEKRVEFVLSSNLKMGYLVFISGKTLSNKIYSVNPCMFWDGEGEGAG